MVHEEYLWMYFLQRKGGGSPLGSSLENGLDSSYLIAQPGNHALRIEVPRSSGLFNAFTRKLWDIAEGTKSFHTKSIDVLICRNQIIHKPLFSKWSLMSLF